MLPFGRKRVRMIKRDSFVQFLYKKPNKNPPSNTSRASDFRTENIVVDCGNQRIQKPTSRDRMDSSESSEVAFIHQKLLWHYSSKLWHFKARCKPSCPWTCRSSSVSHQTSHSGGLEASALRHGQGQPPSWKTSGLTSMHGTTLQGRV